MVCLECPLSNYPWSLKIGRLRAKFVVVVN